MAKYKNITHLGLMSGECGPGVGVETPVESAELHHVVHQVDDGLQPRHLLLQAPRVLPQLFSPLADNKQTKESSSGLPAALLPPSGQKTN